MIKKSSLFLFISITCFSSFAQNLVLNNSFEDTIFLPKNSLSPIDLYSNNWATPIGHTGTSDLYHLDNIVNILSIPNNFTGLQDTFHKKAYAGVFVYGIDNSSQVYNYREYLTGKLYTKLVNNQCYRVSFTYSLAEYVSSYIINDLGIYFSDSLPVNNSLIYNFNNLNYSPQITINQWLNDTLKWIKIERYFIAQGNEKFFTFGNFNDNTTSNISYLSNHPYFGKYFSYIYLDDIHVEAVPTLSLPQINLGTDTILCVGEQIEFDSLLPSNPIYVWNNMVESSDSSFVIDSSGTYWVEAYNGCSYSTDTIKVEFVEPKVELGNDTILCKAQNIVLNSGYYHPQMVNFWQKDNFPFSSQSSVIIQDSGIYTLNTTVGHCSDTDTIKINYTLFSINLGNDTTLCQGEEITLKSNLNNASFVWQDNSNLNNLKVFENGDYSLKATIDNCIEKDTIKIDFLPEIGNVKLKDTLFCDAENKVLDAQTSYEFNNYYWNTTDTTPTITIEKSGNYWVEISNNCFKKKINAQIKVETLEQGLNNYNIFSPNGDFVNDVFSIYEGNNEEYKIEIYNRWGILIWGSSDPGNYWMAEGVNDGIYYFNLQFRNCAGETITKKGSVVVGR